MIQTRFPQQYNQPPALEEVVIRYNAIGAYNSAVAVQSNKIKSAAPGDSYSALAAAVNDLTFNSQADDMQYHSVVQYMCKGAFPAFPRCNVQASAIVFNPAVQPQIRESGEVSEISFAAGAEGVVCGCTGSEMAFVAAGLLHMCSLHAAN